jgi:hypothetical protein
MGTPACVAPMGLFAPKLMCPIGWRVRGGCIHIHGVIVCRHVQCVHVLLSYCAFRDFFWTQNFTCMSNVQCVHDLLSYCAFRDFFGTQNFTCMSNVQCVCVFVIVFHIHGFLPSPKYSKKSRACRMCVCFAGTLNSSRSILTRNFTSPTYLVALGGTAESPIYTYIYMHTYIHTYIYEKNTVRN